MPVRHGAFASSVAVLVASLVVLAVLSAVHASSTCLSRPGVQEARANLARALPPPCPDEGWVPHILSQKCYKRFERQVDFVACQTEVCGPRNATIVTPRTEEIQRFVHLKVVAPHVGVDAVRSQEAYWIGMYRQPELRERWVWVSYGLLEDMADARPVSRSFFWAASENQPNDWEGRESCAIARALGNHYDVSCQGRYNDGQRFKYPCVCQFPDVPHPEFELDMHASRDVQAHTIASHTAERVFMYAAYALFGLYVLLFCRAAVVVAAGSATTRPHALGARAREALTIFPLGLTLTVGAGVAGGKVEPKTPLEAWPSEFQWRRRVHPAGERCWSACRDSGIWLALSGCGGIYTWDRVWCVLTPCGCGGTGTTSAPTLTLTTRTTRQGTSERTPRRTGRTTTGVLCGGGWTGGSGGSFSG